MKPKSDQKNLEELERQIRNLNDEQVLKLFLHVIRDRVRTKEIKSLSLLQEIARELEQVGI